MDRASLEVARKEAAARPSPAATTTSIQDVKPAAKACHPRRSCEAPKPRTTNDPRPRLAWPRCAALYLPRGSTVPGNGSTTPVSLSWMLPLANLERSAETSEVARKLHLNFSGDGDPSTFGAPAGRLRPNCGQTLAGTRLTHGRIPLNLAAPHAVVQNKSDIECACGGAAGGANLPWLLTTDRRLRSVTKPGQAGLRTSAMEPNPRHRDSNQLHHVADQALRPPGKYAVKAGFANIRFRRTAFSAGTRPCGPPMSALALGDAFPKGCIA